MVVITGGANGIGRSVAFGVLARGGHVAIIDSDGSAAELTARELGRDVVAYTVDVRDVDSLDDTFNEIASRFGGIDVVIAGAGMERSGLTGDSGARDQHRIVVDVNLLGVWNTACAGLPHIVKRQGHFVAISSVAAYLAAPMSASYCSSKAGVEQLLRCLRIELASVGVTAGVVHFGMVDTAVVAGLDADPMMAELVRRVPRWISKIVTPEQAAGSLLRGIERRSPRTIYPARWRLAYALRGLAGPALDWAMTHNPTIIKLVGEVRQRDHRAELDLETM